MKERPLSGVSLMQEDRDIKQQFIAAFEAHSDELFRHAALRLPDRERALELVQESYLRAWEYARRGEHINELRPFLFRTLRNLIIDEYRKHKNISLESLKGEDDESTEVLMPPDETNTLEAAMNRFEGQEVLRSVYRLPEGYRDVVLLRYVEGWPPRDIAAHLGVSDNVVSVRLHRALRRLREVLEKHYG